MNSLEECTKSKFRQYLDIDVVSSHRMSPILRDLGQVQQGDMASYKDIGAYSSSG